MSARLFLEHMCPKGKDCSLLHSGPGTERTQQIHAEQTHRCPMTEGLCEHSFHEINKWEDLSH